MAQQIAFFSTSNPSAKLVKYNNKVEKALIKSGIPHTKVFFPTGIKVLVDEPNIAAAAKVITSVPRY